MTLTKRIGFGFRSFFFGFAAIRKHASLRKYIITPVLITTVFLILGIYFSVTVLPAWFGSVLWNPDGWILTSLYWLALLIIGITSFVLVILNAFVLANIINIPFNTLLCERYLEKEFGWTTEKKSFKDFIRANLYFFAIGIVKSLILIFLGLAAFLLSFFPVFSLVATFIGLLILSFDCSDVTFELRELGLRQRWNFFKTHFAEFGGFSLGIGLFSLVPGLNFILLPFIVLGASHLVHTLYEGKRYDSVSSSRSDNTKP